jgi:hypothetical protein
MPARSTRVFLSNQTSHTLYNLGANLDHGAWTNNQSPPASIAPGAVGYWESESDGIATGTEGNISFGIGAAGKAGTPVAAVSRNPGQLDIFFTGQDGIVYTAGWNAATGWSEFLQIGGVFPAGAPVTAVSRNPDQLDLFVIGNDGDVYTSAWTMGGSWSGIGNRWWNIGGTFPRGARVAAVSRAANILDLFVTGNDGCVYTSNWTQGAAWTGIGNKWWNIGGIFPAGAPVTAASRASNILDVFITGNDGIVYTSNWTQGGAWTGIGNKWWNIGGIFPKGAPLAVVSRAPNMLDVFVTGNDGIVYTSNWTDGGAWTGIGNRWWNIGGMFPAGASLAAVSRNQGQLDVFVTGNDGCVYTSAWTAGGTWTGIGNRWWNIGGFFPVGALLAAVTRNPNQLDVFIVGNDGAVYTSSWTAGGAWTGIGNKWFGLAQAVHFHWDNPFSGQDKYNLTVSNGFQCFRDAGAGNNADVHITLRAAVPHYSGFLPSKDGFRFPNSFGNVPYTLPPLKGSVLDYKYGNASNGLCGGMVDAARDYFQATVPIPSTTTPPAGEQDPLFNYIVSRLFDTFDVDDVTLYLKYMDPAYPDTDENVANSLGIVDGRASVVINTEWPIIRADIDSGSTSCLGLVTVKSLLPTDLGKCHQVLCYGYLEDGMNVTMYIYDPNQNGVDGVTIRFNTQDWSVPINIVHNVDVTENKVRLPIYCLFRTLYNFHQPPVIPSIIGHFTKQLTDEKVVPGVTPLMRKQGH